MNVVVSSVSVLLLKFQTPRTHARAGAERVSLRGEEAFEPLSNRLASSSTCERGKDTVLAFLPAARREGSGHASGHGSNAEARRRRRGGASVVAAAPRPPTRPPPGVPGADQKAVVSRNRAAFPPAGGGDLSVVPSASRSQQHLVGDLD